MWLILRQMIEKTLNIRYNESVFFKFIFRLMGLKTHSMYAAPKWYA